VAGEPNNTLLQLDGVELRAIYLERDGTRIELLHYRGPGHRGDREPRPMNALGLTHLSLRVDDLGDTARALEAAGGRVLRHTATSNPALGAAAVFVVDPDGTRVELVQAPGDPARLPGEK
jgi:catechol 2,3-dioxygenase-like lactoylglutathione lyase family enzyme